MMLRTVVMRMPLPLAAIVPATPELSTCVVETGSPKRSAPRIVSIATSPAEANEVTLRNECYTAARQLIRSGELDKALPPQPQNILAPTDLGTELLFFTPHHIVASNYHREGPGIKYVWSTDALTSEKELKAHLHERHIQFILSCPKVQPEEDSLLQAYVHGSRLPHWLVRVPYQLPASTVADKPTPQILPLLVKVRTP